MTWQPNPVDEARYLNDPEFHAQVKTVELIIANETGYDNERAIMLALRICCGLFPSEEWIKQSKENAAEIQRLLGQWKGRVPL